MADNKNLIKQNGRFHMDDASSQPAAQHSAQAEAKIVINDASKSVLLANDKPKTDVFTTAKVAGIQAAKKSADFIPLHHSNALNWVDIVFDVQARAITITSTVKAVTRTSLQMEALTAVTVAALTLVDFCKDKDPEIMIKEIKSLPKETKKKILAVNTPLKVGIVVISDRIIAGLAEDETGQVLKDGFIKAGYNADNYAIISNDSDKLIEKMQEWLQQDVELIITTGGNGIGPRDITLTSLEPFFDFRLEGLEQTLHSIAQLNNNGFYVDRLAAGKIGKTLVICLPLDEKLAGDALNILLPNVHLAFEF